MLLRDQSKGEPDSWPNFIIHNTPGLRAMQSNKILLVRTNIN